MLLAVYHTLWYNVNMRKKKTSIRLSEEAQIFIEQLSKQLGISQSAVLEQAIRVEALREGIPPNRKDEAELHSSPQIRNAFHPPHE